MARKGRWFEGNVFSMPLKEFQLTKNYERGVMRPTALETKKRRGKAYSRYYYKPLSFDETI